MLEIYGLEHMLYLVIVIPFIVFSIYIIKRYINDKKILDKTIRIIGVVYLIIILWNRVVVSIYEVGFSHVLPSLYCGVSSIFLSISMIVLKRDHPFFHCLIYISLLGGLLTLIYPDFIVHNDSIFYLPTITGLIHHSFLVFVPLLMIFTSYVKPDMKKFYILPFGLAIYIALGVFEITVLGYEDAMYIFHPAIKDTIFNWFVLALIFFPTHFIFLVVWHYLPIRYKPKDIYT